jgi:excisionase family DNA binding protein
VRKATPLATPEQVSEYLGIPLGTLYQWRHRGRGPRSFRLGNHVRYEWRDVEDWLNASLSATRRGGAVA